MIGFRHADPRFPFLWESTAQPQARWHTDGSGPVQYLAESPDGAWAELLRHEGITEAADLDGLRRALWAIDLPEVPETRPALPTTDLLGDIDSWTACQAEAERLRTSGALGLVAPSAALASGSSGFGVHGGLQPGPARTESVMALFGPRPDLVGWAACAVGRPRADLLARVRLLG